MPTNKIIRFLLELAKEQSEIFSSPGATLLRRSYRAEHPTEIWVNKCMDGRIKLPYATNTPAGIIQPCRSLGGKFDFGWPFLSYLVASWVNYAISRGRSCVIFNTYHFSKGDEHRGCYGFRYDKAAAKAHALELNRQVEEIYGDDHQIVYPICLAFETDEDALMLHGQGDQILNLAEIEANISDDELRLLVEKLFPDMNRQMVDDLLPLIRGNLCHVAEIRRTQRPIEEMVHGEFILAYGRGFDWLHLPNKALIVGPYAPNQGDSIVAAAGILLDNLKSGRISEKDGVVLMTSAPYRDVAGPEPRLAQRKAKTLAQFAWETIRDRVPELLPHLQVLTGTTNENTRLYTPFDFLVTK